MSQQNKRTMPNRINLTDLCAKESEDFGSNVILTDWGDYMRVCIAIISAVLISSCNRDGLISGGDVQIDPRDPDALSEVLILPSGTETRQGQPPGESNSATRPNIRGGIDRLNSSNGSTAILPFIYTTNGNIVGCILYIDGAGRYFYLPYTRRSSTSGTLSIPVGLPTNLSAGSFTALVRVIDEYQEVSNAIRTTVIVLELGSGSLQISLSWDNSADVDLWVTDPSDTKIFWRNSTSTTGGALDRDDIDGYGPENVFWEDAPDGRYRVEVDHFGGSLPVSYIVTVNGLGRSRQFSGTLRSRGETDLITTINKSGGNISFN